VQENLAVLSLQPHWSQKPHQPQPAGLRWPGPGPWAGV